MSPTVFRARGLRFFFYSREEFRRHVHVESSGGEAKFWLEPRMRLAYNRGLDSRALAAARALIREHRHEIDAAWDRHFGPP